MVGRAHSPGRVRHRGQEKINKKARIRSQRFGREQLLRVLGGGILAGFVDHVNAPHSNADQIFDQRYHYAHRRSARDSRCRLSRLTQLKRPSFENPDVQVLCLGYRCACGERVTVFRVLQETITLLDTKVVTCGNGHPRTVSPDQFWTLEEWTETEKQPATGTEG